MLITDVQPIIVRVPPLDQHCEWGYDAFLVKVFTDDGLVGIGASDTNPYVAKAIVNAHDSNFYSIGLRRLLLGEDPLDIQRLWNKMYYYSNYFGRRGAVIHAISAIDIALWDIASQFYKVPISTLLGGKQHDKIKVYASLDDAGCSLEEGVERAIHMKELGFRSLKLGVGYRDIETDYKRLCAYRKALGDEMEFQIDACSHWRTFGQAAKAFKMYEELNLNFIEEPVLADDMNAYARLSGLTKAKTAGGESLTTRYEFNAFIQNAKPDIVQPDITRCGGITELKKIYDIAAMNGCEVVPHDWSTAVLVSATIQFLASTEAPPFFEYCMSESPIYLNMFANKPSFEDGYVKVPDCIGLGLELDEEFVSRYEVK